MPLLEALRPWLLAISCGASASFCTELTSAAEDAVSARPVLHVDVRNPTGDKPQSKLWFAHDTWWAWLPSRQGSSVWRRTERGWQREASLERELRQATGRADVWSEGNFVHAVLVDREQLTVATLRFDEQAGVYAVAGQPIHFEVSGGEKHDSIETATIAHDDAGRWWIAYPWQRRMWIRATSLSDANDWSEPFAVSDVTDRDDLCALVKIPGAVGLAWSNQSNETMNFRLHKDGHEIQAWDPVEEIARGNRTADDHINAKVGPDGTLYLATKNSVDQIGEPQLVLRVRSPQGVWRSLPYAPRTKAVEPSRPLALLGGASPQLFLIHTLYDRTQRDRRAPGNDTIEWHAVQLEHLDAAALAAKGQTLIGSVAGVNNVTGCKQTLPNRAPWIVLASDAQGNVYEGRLPVLEAPTTIPSP